MQTQDASAEFLIKAWPWLEANKNRLIGVGVAIIALWGVWYFIASQKEQNETEAGQALTALMLTPPTGNLADAFAGVAVKYPGTAAGQRALLQAGAALFTAGKYPEAQTQFQKYLEAGSSSPLAAAAQLGVAASLEAQNKLDLAAAAYQRVISAYAGSSSVLQAEFALGRIAESQNKLTEALSHFENAARNGMGGSLGQEAAMHASALKSKTAASAPKPVATPVNLEATPASAFPITATNKAP